MTFTEKYKDIIIEAVNVLKAGGVILYPTDTIWGIGCDATNEEAVKKIYAIKQREESKSLIVLVDDDRKLNRYVKNIPEIAWDIVEFATKPTTIIYDEACNLAKNVIAQDGSIAIRVCQQEMCQQIIHRLNKPLVSTSANISGKPSPASFKDIPENIKNQIDFIVDIPELYQSKSSASTILRIKNNMEVVVLRK